VHIDNGSFELDIKKKGVAEVEERVSHIVRCPIGECKGFHDISYFAERNSFSVGPWYCDACGAGVMLVKNNGLVNYKITGERKVDRLVLLDMAKDAKDVKIIVEGMRHEGGRHGSEEGDDKYFYNEHTCPTNYLTGIVKIIEGEDADPHGIFEFNKGIDVDDADLKIAMAGEDDLDRLTCKQLLALFDE